MDLDSPVYEVRFGWTRRHVTLVVGCVLFAAATLLPGMPVVGRVLGLVLFGGGAVSLTLVAMSGAVALRIDEQGVLLGGTPPRHRATTASVPWAEIEAVVIWENRVQHNRLLYVGVQRRPGLPPLPGVGTGAVSRRTVHRLLPHIPPQVALSSRSVHGWSLDEERFAAAVAHFASHVPVIDARQPR